MELFDPKLLFETDAAKKAEHKYAMYKSFNEYVVCDVFERDGFLAAGYSPEPTSFIKHVDISPADQALHILKDANVRRQSSNAEARAEIDGRTKRRPKTGRIVDDEGNSLAVDEEGNEYILNKQVVI